MEGCTSCIGIRVIGQCDQTAGGEGQVILRLAVGANRWIVSFVEADDEIISVCAFASEDDTPVPGEPNVHWDVGSRNFDETPEGLPTRVRTAIYQWMRERY